MEVKISRIDPTLACNVLAWSSDAVLAIGTTNGVVLLEPDAEVLSNSSELGIRDENQWHRHELGIGESSGGCPVAKDTVTDVAWSPPLPGLGCVLAALTNRGAIYVAMSRVKHVWRITEQLNVRDIEGGRGQCIAWRDQVLVVGTSSGVRLFDFNNSTARAADCGQYTLGKPVIQIATLGERMVTAMSDNTLCDVGVDDLHFDLKPSKHLVSSVLVLPDAVIVAQTGKVTKLPGLVEQKLDTRDLITLASLGDGNWLALSNKGFVHGFPALQKYFAKNKRTNLHIFGVAKHPSQPVLAVLYNTVRPNEWRAPILSTQSARLLFIPIDDPQPFKYGAGDAVSYWLANAVQSKPSDSPEIDLTTSKIPPLEEFKPSQNSHSLQEKVVELFDSPWFDKIRLQWAVSDEETREALTKRAREAIGLILQHETSSCPIDAAVIQSYTGKAAQTREIEVSGGFFSEAFDFSQKSNVLTSKSGSVWRRCAVTLLPTLTLDSRESADGRFSILPTTSTVVDKSPLAKALIQAAGEYCPFNGSRWLRRRETT